MRTLAWKVYKYHAEISLKRFRRKAAGFVDEVEGEEWMFGKSMLGTIL